MKSLLLFLLFVLGAAPQTYSRAVDPIARTFTEQGIQEAIEFAAAAGSRHLHVSPLWDDFETSPGVYNFSVVDRAAGHAKRLGLVMFTNFRVIDTHRSAVPSFYSQYRFNHPYLRSRLNNALSALHGQFSTFGVQVKWITVGNEVDGYLKTSTLVSDYRTLFLSAKSRLNQLWPGVPVSFTMMSTVNRQLLAPLMSAADFYSFTYYPLNPDFTTNPVDGIAIYNTMSTLMGLGKPVFWQEIGFPSAAECHSSQLRQAEFVQWVVAILDYLAANGTPALGATLFALHDFPPEFVAQLVLYYGAGTPEFVGFLGSLGLIDSQGTSKLAWSVAADWLRRP